MITPRVASAAIAQVTRFGVSVSAPMGIEVLDREITSGEAGGPPHQWRPLRFGPSWVPRMPRSGQAPTASASLPSPWSAPGRRDRRPARSGPRRCRPRILRAHAEAGGPGGPVHGRAEPPVAVDDAQHRSPGPPSMLNSQTAIRSVPRTRARISPGPKRYGPRHGRGASRPERGDHHEGPALRQFLEAPAHHAPVDGRDGVADRPLLDLTGGAVAA